MFKEQTIFANIFLIINFLTTVRTYVSIHVTD